MNCQHCGNKLPEPVMDGGTCPSCHKNTGLFNEFNLVEELAKTLMNKAFTDGADYQWNHESDCAEWLREVYIEDVKLLLPIFEEFIKQVNKISPYEPYSENEDREYRVARTCWNNGFNKAIETILSELEKYVVMEKFDKAVKALK